jgi:regulatory protein
MVQITNIKYSDNYFKINLDTGESLSLTPELYNIYDLHKGKEIDSELYLQLKEESLRLNCRQKALKYLAIRSHSYREMRVYLTKKGFPGDIIDEILKSFKDQGYIDDYDFAVRYINSKKRSKIVGVNVLKRDLFKKGVNKDIIKKAVRKTGADKTDPDEIYSLAVKKIKSLENKKNKLSKLVYFLKQKGFIDDQVRLVIDRLGEDGYI